MHDIYTYADFREAQSETQACFDHCYPTHGDIHRLDHDNDRIAYESLP